MKFLGLGAEVEIKADAITSNLFRGGSSASKMVFDVNDASLL
jgi:hypothetical protein